MKILVIDEELPYPVNSGKRSRTFNLTRLLASDNEITYLAYGTPDSESFRQLRRHKISPVVVRPPQRTQAGVRFYARLLLNLFSPYPYIVTSHYTRRFRDRLNELLAASRYDVLICEWTPYAVFIRDLHGPATVIVAHNIESSIWRRYEAYEKNPLKKLYIAIQRRKVERFERQCFGWADGATAVSKEEADAIEAYGAGYTVQVIENGVDMDYFRPQAADVNRDLVVFTGAMDWRPNQDAARYFVENVFPLLRRRRPCMKAVLVGRNPTAQVTSLARVDGVTVTGTVDDVRPYIARAAVYVVPLRIGGGSRLKILEAMAMEKAVVSTSVGAEGLAVTDGDNIIIADGDESFARSVLRCIDDEVLRQSVARGGRLLVESHYRWQTLAARLNRYLNSLAGGK
ncbi:MAG TPA: glycosyltransferase [Acidobacteriota bacterium]|nr:glycosyltransferase [Acidobacteriota bacterium]